MHYLDIKRGGLFVAQDVEGKDPAAVDAKLRPHSLSLVHLHDFADPAGQFAAAGFGQVTDQGSLVLWRFSYWIERTLVTKLRECAKSTQRVGLGEALKYHRLINDEIFFNKSNATKLDRLYQAFKEHPRLSLGVAIEMDGGQYDAASQEQNNPRIREAMFDGEHLMLQACFLPGT